MAITAPIACWLVSLSLAISFAAQIYGILSTPNMKEVHDANLSFWSPQPLLIAPIFFSQQFFQLVFIRCLYKSNAKSNSEEKIGIELLKDYAPYLSIGNISLAIWMIFWNQSDLKTANIFVLINSSIQIYYVFARLSPMYTRSTSSLLTHLVSKTFAGIGLLDLLHNGSVAYFDHQGPNKIIMIVTGVGFSLLACKSDWIFGGCLVYDLVALSIGQRGIGETTWGNLLAMYAICTAGIVGLRNFMNPPYDKIETKGYEAVSGDEPTI